MDHYKDQVRFIYKDDPLVEIHPWAMHAAVDADCLAAESATGYWNLVDYIHAHGDEITGDRNHPDLAATMKKLDELTEAEGRRQKVNAGHLKSCIAKQDESAVRSSMKEAGALGINGTPTIFINGEQMTGLVPQDVLWQTIDRAIEDAGGTPPANPAAHPATK
jgi:protein-disulfide isomerase